MCSQKTNTLLKKMFSGNRWTLWINILPWTLKKLSLNEALIHEEILQSWNTKIQVRVHEAARGDKMHSGVKCGGWGWGGNKMITELQKKWEPVQDQIYVLKNLVLDAKTRNEGNKNEIK